MVKRAMRWCFGALFGVLLFSTGKSANRGTRTGVITDPAEALIPDVKVTARKVATGIETSTLASSTGTYRFRLYG